MVKILDGKTLSGTLAVTLAKKISRMSVKPKLVIIQIGEHEESNRYVKHKIIFGERIGAIVEYKKYAESVSEKKVLADIAKYNADRTVHGIIIQLPLPRVFSASNIVESVDPSKDVDGLTSKNTQAMFINEERFLPATTRGILTLLKHYKIPIAKKKVVMVGASLIVGKPTALAMLNRGATVTVCNENTKNISEETRTADILIVAVGQAGFITEKFVSKGQVVIDVGVNVIRGSGKNAGKNKKPGGEKSLNRVVGDVDFEKVKDIVSAITPVPGGVGPMTIVSLFENLMEAFKG